MNAIYWRATMRFSTAFLAAFGVAQLSACHDAASTSVKAGSTQEESPDPALSTTASLNGLNYTTFNIARFAITDANANTGGGANISPSDGDGHPTDSGEMCCVIVPNRWEKDMTVTVRWSSEKVADGKTPGTWYRAVVRVPPYTRLTHGFWVRFLRNDKIVVQVNDQEWYVPKPVENESAYIVQGVVDEKATREINQ